jgi:tRNA (guanine-N7-)-methyltransferase
MGKYKLRQFAELDTFSNVVHHLQTAKDVPDHPNKGKWSEVFYNNDHDIILELGCGKGEYTLALARCFPEANFMGVDFKGNRLWRGAKTALEEKYNNVGFLRTKIQNIDTVFDKNEVSEIWITFPDPMLGDRREKHRLTSPGFLSRYKNILKSGGKMHLKTDSRELYDYSYEVINEQAVVHAATSNLYKESNGYMGNNHDLLISVQTYYEQKYLAAGKPICYLQWTFE